jgi:hypothetical protein
MLHAVYAAAQPLRSGKVVTNASPSNRVLQSIKKGFKRASSKFVLRTYLRHRVRSSPTVDIATRLGLHVCNGQKVAEGRDRRFFTVFASERLIPA